MNQQATEVIELEYLYLDNETCSRCRSSEDAFDKAVEMMRPILEATGRRLSIRRRHVNSLELAESLGLQSSPSIRINGRDIQPEASETHCAECSGLAGGTAVECRVWEYRGDRTTELPVGLLLEEITRTVWGGDAVQAQPADAPVPENIRRYFEARAGAGCGCGRGS